MQGISENSGVLRECGSDQTMRHEGRGSKTLLGPP